MTLLIDANKSKITQTEEESGTCDRFLSIQVYYLYFVFNRASDRTKAHLFGDVFMYPCGCIAQAWTVAEVLRAYQLTINN